MEETQACSSISDSEPPDVPFVEIKETVESESEPQNIPFVESKQNVASQNQPENFPFVEIKQTVESSVPSNLESGREELEDDSEGNGLIPPPTHEAVEQSHTATKQSIPYVDAITSNNQESQQHRISSYKNFGVEMFSRQKLRNTLDSKLASLFPTRYTGYFQTFGNPLKLVTPLVQGAMQSALDCSKSFIQTREMMDQIKKLPVAQPLSDQLLSSVRTQHSLSTVAASYGIRGDLTVPCYPSCAIEVPRAATPITFTQTKGHQPCLTTSIAVPLTPVCKMPSPMCTTEIDTLLRESDVHMESCYSTDLQPKSVYNTIAPSSKSLARVVPSATSTTDTLLKKPGIPCTEVPTDSKHRSICSIVDPSPRIATRRASSEDLELSNDTTSITIVDEIKFTAVSSSRLDLSAGDETHIPDFQTGKVNAKQFPPRYYDINSLKIGSWKYEHKRLHCVSRLKIIFTQRKFVYEFQVNANEVSVENSQVSPAVNNKQMACIEIPFRTVVGINVSRTLPAEVVIEVDTVPAMWLGTQIVRQRSHGVYTKNQYNTLRSVDLTGGQLSKVPYHKLTISSTAIITQLMKFDPRFSALLRIPIKFDASKAPPRPIKRLSPVIPTKRKRSQVDQESSTAVKQEHDLEAKPKCLPWMQSNMSSLDTCACTSGCTTRRCNCVKEVRKCQECRCVPCKNPLNILEEFEVDLEEAKNDCCLMQSLPKIYDLRTLLREKSVPTPCCGKLLPLKSCCVGIVECPECECKWRYSWCSGDLCDEDNRPRNHCEICQTCRDYRDQHCSHCNRCFFAGSYGFACPCHSRSTSYM